MVHHRDGLEENNSPGNLQWACRSCNNRIAVEMVREGRGRRTCQFNPGAETLAEYVQAAVEHRRGAQDPGGLLIHQTPSAQRREFAAEIWRRRRERGTDRPSR